MGWITEELNDIVRPYTLRSFYNRHKIILLKEPPFDLLKTKISDLKYRYRNISLESKSLEHLEFDIECDKEKFDEFGWLPDSMEDILQKQRLDEIRIKESEKHNCVDFDSKNLMEKARLLYIPESEYLEIKILKYDVDMEQKVKDEIFRIAFENCDNQGSMSKFLGASPRTIRNRLHKLLARVVQ